MEGSAVMMVGDGSEVGVVVAASVVGRVVLVSKVPSPSRPGIPIDTCGALRTSVRFKGTRATVQLMVCMVLATCLDMN